jgi:hypothetical protein
VKQNSGVGITNMNSDYLGESGIPGISEWQQRCVEALVAGAPAEWHDNLLREIFAVVGDTPTTDATLKAAVHTALADSGVPLLHPFTTCGIAAFNAGAVVAAAAAQSQLLGGPLGGSVLCNIILGAVELLKTALTPTASLGCDIAKA